MNTTRNTTTNLEMERITCKDCRYCGWWRNRTSTRKGVRIPDGTGKCTRPQGHCDPEIVKGRIGEGPIVRNTIANTTPNEERERIAKELL